MKLSENSGSQPNLHLFEQESQLQRSPGVNDRNSGVFYGHPVGGASGMTAARSHQNLAHIGGFAQPTIYSPNDRRSSQPGSPMSPVSPILPVNHFTGGAPHPAFNGVPITPYGLNSPDSASISSDSPSQVRPFYHHIFNKNIRISHEFPQSTTLTSKIELIFPQTTSKSSPLRANPHLTASTWPPTISQRMDRMVPLSLFPKNSSRQMSRCVRSRATWASK